MSDDTGSQRMLSLLNDEPASTPVRIQVDPELLDAAARSMSEATRRALKADLGVFTDWARQQGYAVPPATASQVAQFIRDRAAAGRKIATISRYVSSIATWHKLLRLPNPAADALVRMELKAQRVALGVRQKQATGLRFRGDVADPLTAVGPVGVCVEAMLTACADDIPGLRDKALLSVAYDTGLRRSELVSIVRTHIERGTNGGGRLFVHRTKTDQEARGAYAFLSPRSMEALKAWLETARIKDGAVFRRLHKSKTKEGDIVWTVGAKLTPQSVSLIYRTMLTRAHDAGLLGMIDPAEFDAWRNGLSAHSTRVGLTQDLFAAGQDLGGIMQALRWKSPTQPARYAQALSVESNAAARVVGKL